MHRVQEKGGISQMSGRFQGLHTGKILIIDSNSGVRLALHKVLEAYGFGVTSHETGEQSIPAVVEHNYGIVICNQHLSGIDGLGFFEKVQPFLANCITVLTAAYGTESIYKKAQQLGINIFMEMPFKVENLIKCIGEPTFRASQRLSSKHIHITSSGRILSICPPMNPSIPVSKEIRPRSSHRPIERMGRRWEVYSNHDHFTSADGLWVPTT